jgi:hypothetical protein
MGVAACAVRVSTTEHLMVPDCQADESVGRVTGRGCGKVCEEARAAVAGRIQSCVCVCVCVCVSLCVQGSIADWLVG